MNQEQVIFDQKLSLLTSKVTDFTLNYNIDKFEDNAKDACHLQGIITLICEQAKTFNLRESLTGDGDETSYEGVF